MHAAQKAVKKDKEEDKKGHAMRVAASAFKKEGKSFRDLRVQHERLWILRDFTILGSMMFLGLQVWHTCALDNVTSKGFAFIAQPLR